MAQKEEIRKNLRSGNPQKRSDVIREYKTEHAEIKAKPLKNSFDGLNPAWLVPTMIGLFLLGIAWVVIFYMTAEIGGYPIPVLRYGNFAVGFGFIIAGFALSTKWK